METIGKKEKTEILEKAKSWFREKLAVAHKNNTLKLKSLKKFKVNPFTLRYLGYFFEGNNSPETLAKVLIYPRILGTSISTSFGSGAQDFISKVFKDSYGSMISGIDIEFIDKIDGRKKYCQIKAGPNVVNKDDVTTIKDHFREAIARAKTNNLPIQVDDYLFCLLYGEPGEENGSVKKIKKDYTVVMGKEFWIRFTGDPNFYKDLAESMGEVAKEFNMKKNIKKVVKELAVKIKEKYGE